MEQSKELVLKSQEGLLAVANKFINEKGGEIVLPPNYDVNNAVKYFWLQLLQTKDKQDRPALEVCTPISIKMAVQKMITKGVDPSKNQCYLIPRGKVLNLEIGAFGNIKQTMSVCRIKINSVVIYDGDSVDIEIRPNGTKIIHHKTSWKNMQGGKIIGAYAVGTNMDTGEVDNSDIMTAEEIKKSQLKSSNYGKVHNEFPHEMARKTVASRLAKHYINTSDDSGKIEVFDENGNRITCENNYDYLKEQKIDANESLNNDEQVIIIDDEEPIMEETDEDFVNDSFDDLPDLEPIKNEDGTMEVWYAEYKNNKDKYNLVAGSYDAYTKKCKVTLK